PGRQRDVGVVTDVASALMRRHVRHRHQPCLDDGLEKLVVVAPVILSLVLLDQTPPDVEENRMNADFLERLELLLEPLPCSRRILAMRIRRIPNHESRHDIQVNAHDNLHGKTGVYGGLHSGGCRAVTPLENVSLVVAAAYRQPPVVETNTIDTTSGGWCINLQGS